MLARTENPHFVREGTPPAVGPHALPAGLDAAPRYDWKLGFEGPKPLDRRVQNHATP